MSRVVVTLKHVVASESTDMTCDRLEVHTTLSRTDGADFKSKSVQVNRSDVCLEGGGALVCVRARESFAGVVVFVLSYFLHDHVASNTNVSRL